MEGGFSSDGDGALRAEFFDFPALDTATIIPITIAINITKGKMQPTAPSLSISDLHLFPTLRNRKPHPDSLLCFVITVVAKRRSTMWAEIYRGVDFAVAIGAGLVDLV